ncbi:pre-rRNA-processing protein FHL1-like isoform X2 [Aphidius gifuensis]|uniref:pre-rRNA-processing protein FHL1-like isoform X2 n=1 Tax=Aphidius gifuensis TaxID=684658 RepID=UPI001CDD2349|nr:pre-rRNA-processing protein FHL1-like isoform X2 [Aphidius gifuensis]
MIGPSSGVNDVKNHDENPVRIKRKIFEELDIDSFCDEVCQSAKKCNSMESQILNIDTDDIELSLSSVSPSQSPLIQDTINNDSVTRLEVLVVDGTWDVSNLAGADFIDFLPGLNHETGITIGHNNIDNIDNNYGTILSYWEPETTETSDCTNILDNHELSSSELTQPQQQQQQHQRSSSVVNYETQISTGNQQDDQENANLSWLIDFKLDNFIEAPEEKTILPCTRTNNNVNKNRNQATTTTTTSTTTYHSDNRKSYNSENNEQVIKTQSQITTSYIPPIDNRNYSSSVRSDGPKKPPFTYTELIEHALHEKGELTVSAIYQWISEHFPYYKSNDDRWKNSVRHNLSINPHFRKGSKAPHGAGHLWAIANREDMRPRQLTAMQNFISNSTLKQGVKNSSELNYTRKNSTENTTRQCVAIDEVAAATASISQSTDEDILSSSSSSTLEHCAEQILNGIKREVEVQYLVPMTQQNNSNNDHQSQSTDQTSIDKATDFLNPVSKEVVAEECGLIGEGYLVTDLNPSTFGLSMAESEIITSENLFGEELSFQFYELSSSSQIQSA